VISVCYRISYNIQKSRFNRSLSIIVLCLEVSWIWQNVDPRFICCFLFSVVAARLYEYLVVDVHYLYVLYSGVVGASADSGFCARVVLSYPEHTREPVVYVHVCHVTQFP